MNLKVADLIDKDRVPSVSGESKIDEIINEISSKMYGATAVISNKKIVGIITDGDLRRVLQKKINIYTLKASDIMNSNPKIISINSQAISSLNIMKKNNISQLLVVDDAKKYVGIIHFHNIMKEGLNNE